MQKSTGADAQSTVGSEIAAILDLVILPNTLRDLLDDTIRHDIGLHGPTEPLEQRCKRFARDIGRPEDWHLVHYPFWLSLDNCQKHPHIRKLWLRPRISARQRVALNAQLDVLEMAHLVAQMQAMLDAGFDARAEFSADVTDGMSDTNLMQLYLQRWRGDLDAAFIKQHECTFKQWQWRQWALKEPWLRIVFAEQFMPLAPKTPEHHMMAEHMVGSVKKDVAKEAADLAFRDDLWKVSTYQEMAQRAVKKRGRGAAGWKHVSGSVRKMPCTAKIVSTPEGVPVTVEHTFSGRARLGSTHVVLGTGGKHLPSGSGAKWK